MEKHKAELARRSLEKIQQFMSQVKSPLEGMSKQEAIDEIRKVREKLWREKFVAHS